MPANRSLDKEQPVEYYFAAMGKLIRQLCALIVLLGLTACNTMRGVGEDISAMGRYISNSTGTTPSHHAPPPPTGTGF